MAKTHNKFVIRWVVTSGSSRIGKKTAFLKFDFKAKDVHACQSGGGAVHINQKSADLLASIARNDGWQHVRVVKVHITEVAE